MIGGRWATTILVLGLVAAASCDNATTTRVPTRATTCDWKFQPGVTNPSRGRLYIVLPNPTSQQISYTQFLVCSSLEIFHHAADVVVIPPVSMLHF